MIDCRRNCLEIRFRIEPFFLSRAYARDMPKRCPKIAPTFNS